MKHLSKSLLFSSLAFVSVILLNACQQKQQTESMNPPIAKIIPKELVWHNHTRTDNYYWLNERSNPEVISYLEQENAYTDAILAPVKELRDALYEEMIARIKPYDETVPVKKGDYVYFTRYTTGSEYPVYLRKSIKGGNEEILLDVNKLAEGKAYFNVSGIDVSPDGNWMVYGVDDVSRRLYKLYTVNLKTGETLGSAIENTSGSVAWASNNQTFFYTLKDTETLRTNKVMKHTIGSTDDKVIFEENDVTFYCGVYRTKSEKYLGIYSSSTLSTEYRFLDANTPDGEFKVFQPRERGLEYNVQHAGNKFYIRTNLNANNFCIMETDEKNTGKKFWKNTIAHRDSVFIEDFEVFAHYLVVQEKSNGLSALRVMEFEGGQHYVQFEEESYSVELSDNEEFDTNLLRYNYTSLTTPNSVYDYNMTAQKATLLKESAVLGGFNKNDYETKRIWATATDGTKVPISIVYKKGLELNGKNPTLIYGYGSYGASMDPWFAHYRLSLLDRGFVFALAHIRGGQEMGRDWYENGKLLQKKNTFTDFIACSQYLIDQKYTNAENLYAMGGSAGGLLMGAVSNMAPQLYKGIVAQVPFVDVVTTMLDESIPLTTGEFDEWGNPKDSVYYNYMLSYSPYDQVKAMNYPAMLITTGLHDSQVQYWEPAKWVAKLRATKTDSNPLLLSTNMDAGHGGASGRFKRYKEIALEYSFLMMLQGIQK